jgi:hypothetical protein
MAEATKGSVKAGRRPNKSKVTSCGNSTKTRYNSKKDKTKKKYRGQGR